MADGNLTYPSIRVGLRAPRVSIVFDASGPDWHFFARLAMWQACQFWGGAGFILVPHVNGRVSPLITQAVIAYDPDYVVASMATVADYEALAPGWIADNVQGYGEIPEDQIDGFRRRLMADPVPDRGTASARDAVAEACSPHRRREDNGNEGQSLARWDEDYQSLDVSDRSAEWHIGALTALTTFSAVAEPSLACPPEWGGVWGLAATAKVGAVRRPHAATEPSVPAP